MALFRKKNHNSLTFRDLVQFDPQHPGQLIFDPIRAYTLLGMHAMHVLSHATDLQEGEKASFHLTTQITRNKSGTETNTVSGSFEPKDTKLLFRKQHT